MLINSWTDFFKLTSDLNHYPVGPHENLCVENLTASSDCATLARQMFVVGLSIIPRTSTIRGVATKQYARNALSRSSGLNQRPHI